MSAWADRNVVVVPESDCDIHNRVDVHALHTVYLCPACIVAENVRLVFGEES